MKIPESILWDLEKIIDNLDGFGTAELSVVLHDHRPRFVLKTEKSVIPGKPTSGSEGERHG
jgi:hypothetical protein